MAPAGVQPEDEAAVQGVCENAVREWLAGRGERAKKVLKQLCKQHPGSPLPRRYLARVLYHEAAGAISPGSVGSGCSLRRLSLLGEAYSHAAEATALAPNSLSCAALRATLAINLLVEESALLNPASPGPSLGGGAAKASTSGGAGAAGGSALDRKCQELLQRFLGSIDACRSALEHPEPLLREPLITLVTATHTTCDPCSLLVEKILDSSGASSAISSQEIVSEKRSVLSSMQQVLQSCYALLDSTQVPLHSIIRLLQHILRPYGAEQQMLASSRVGALPASQPANGSSSSSQLAAAQLHHAAIGELLRLLRPAGSNAGPAAGAGLGAAGSGAGPGRTAAAPAGQRGSVGAADAAAAAAGPLAPLPLSVEKPWDHAGAAGATGAAAAGGKLGSSGGSGRAAGKARAGRARGTASASAAGAKKRFMDVEAFWRSCSPQQRMQLLQVPLAPLLAGVKQEGGTIAAEVLMEGLVLLREQDHTSCHWLCSACDRKFHTGREYSAHVEACHEQLTLLKIGPSPTLPRAGGLYGTPSYVACSKCRAEVVGIYFDSAKPSPAAAAAAAASQQGAQQGTQQQPAQQHQLCLKCYRSLAASVGSLAAEQAYVRVTPHMPPGVCAAWSESGSEFISTRDSFSSCEDEDGGTSGDEAAPAAGAAAPGRAAAKGGAARGSDWSAQQQQRQLAWLSASATAADAAAVCSSSSSAGARHQQPVPALEAPGMFVFGAGSAASGDADADACCARSSTAGAPAHAARDAWALGPPAASGSKLSSGDALAAELLAELEVVHAAHKQPGHAGSAALPAPQQPAGGGIAALALPASVQAAAADAGGGGSSGGAADTGTPSSAGRRWRDWLLPKKLLQWNDEGPEPGGGLGSDDSSSDLAPQPDQRSHQPGSEASSSRPPLLEEGGGPCSPRTPAARDGVVRAQQGTVGAALAAAAASGGADELPAPPGAAAAARAYEGADAAADACLTAASREVLVDEVMRCMGQLYACSADVADMTLRCLVDFVRRKLLLPGAPAAADGSPQLSPAAAAAAARLPSRQQQLLCDFVGGGGGGASSSSRSGGGSSSGGGAFVGPHAMHAALSCLPSCDLHMALAYAVRQQEAPLRAGTRHRRRHSSCSSSGSGSTASTTGSSEGGSDDSSGSSCSDSDSCGSAGEDETVSHSSQLSEEEGGCMSMFQLLHLDEQAFEQLVGQLWPGELPLMAEPAAAAGAPGKKQAASALRPSPQPPGRGGGGRRPEPVLVVAPWWRDHLRQSSAAVDPPADAAADLRLLRWVYGNLTSSQAEEFAARQAALRGGLDRGAALLELYEGMANAWRRMQRVADKQRRLEQLRSSVKSKFAAVKALEEAAGHCTGEQAQAFLSALFTSLTSPGGACGSDSSSSSTAAAGAAGSTGSAAEGSAAGDNAGSGAAAEAGSSGGSSSSMPPVPLPLPQAPPGGQPPQLYLCTPAVAALRAAPVLASEASQRYAAALLAREAAVLHLVEAMLEHDLASAQQRLGQANERLRSRRAHELAAAEAEHARLVADGPASHRKKDLLDKATKESEHRQRLADVRARIDAAKAAIAGDEALSAAAGIAADEAAKALARVQEQARAVAARQRNLQELSAQLAALLPLPPPPPPVAVAAPAPGASSPPRAQTAPAAAAAASPVSLSTASSAFGSPGGSSVASAGTASPGHSACSAGAAPTASDLGCWRSECLMYQVLWVAEAVTLFQGQYDPATVSSQQQALSGPPAPAGQSGPSQAAALPSPASGGLARSQGRTTSADMLRASKWVKEQGEELDAALQAAAEDLSLLRSRVQQLACVDLTFEISEAALAFIRNRIEAAAATAQELRSQQLLLELAAEEDAAKAAAAAAAQQSAATASSASQAQAQGAAGACTGSKASKAKAKRKGKKQQGGAASDEPAAAAAAAAAAAREAEAKQAALEAARAAREAELEQRRRELQALEEAAEAELIRKAQEASLKEQAGKKAAAASAAAKEEQQQPRGKAAQAATSQGSSPGGSSSTGGGSSGTAKAAKASPQQPAPGAAKGAPAAASSAAPSRSAALRSGQQPAQQPQPVQSAAAPASPANSKAAKSAAGGRGSAGRVVPGPGKPGAPAPGGSKRQGAQQAAAAAGPSKGRASGSARANGPASPGVAAPKQRQRQQQPAPSLLDFGPTPAEAYAAAQAGSKEQQQQQQQAQDDAPGAAAATPAAALAAPDSSAALLTADDAVVEMPAASGGGSTSHLAQLTHTGDAGLGSEPPLRSSSSLPSSGSGTGFATAPFGAAAGPAASSLSEAGLGLSSFGSGPSPFSPPGLHSGAELGASAGGARPRGAAVVVGRAPLHLLPAAAGAAGAPGAPGGGLTLPPRPASACATASPGPAGGVPGSAEGQQSAVFEPQGALAADAALSAALAHGGFAEGAGRRRDLAPESPRLGASPAEDAPHIQAIMSLLDGDTGAAGLAAHSSGGNGSGGSGGSQQPPASKGSTAAVAARGRSSLDVLWAPDAGAGQKQPLQRPSSSSSCAAGSPGPPPRRSWSSGASAAASLSCADRTAGPSGAAGGLEAFHRTQHGAQPQQPGSLLSPPHRPPGLSAPAAPGRPSSAGSRDVASWDAASSSRPSSAGSSAAASEPGGLAPRRQPAAQQPPQAAWWPQGVSGGVAQASWAGGAPFAGGAAAAAAPCSAWAGSRVPLMHASDVGAARDQQPAAIVLAQHGLMPAAAKQAAQAHSAHVAAATAAAAAAAAATAAVKQARQQAAAVAAAAATAGVQHSPALAGGFVPAGGLFAPQALSDAGAGGAALLGGPPGGVVLPAAVLGTAAGGFAGLQALGGVPGLGGRVAGAPRGLGGDAADAGLWPWPQQQQQAASGQAGAWQQWAARPAGTGSGW